MPLGKVKDFLTKQCGLIEGQRLPGAIVTFHHEMFGRWGQLIATERMTVPFQVIHVDSHADMGMGDASAGYIMGELLLHYGRVTSQ